MQYELRLPSIDKQADRSHLRGPAAASSARARALPSKFFIKVVGHFLDAKALAALPAIART